MLREANGRNQSGTIITAKASAAGTLVNRGTQKKSGQKKGSAGSGNRTGKENTVRDSPEISGAKNINRTEKKDIKGRRSSSFKCGD